MFFSFLMCTMESFENISDFAWFEGGEMYGPASFWEEIG